jgi:hypothetical protein
LNDATIALKRFYVVTDVSRPASGYSQTWYPHLVRAKCTPLVDSQEFAEILDAPQKDSQGNVVPGTLRDIISTYNKNIEINNAVIAQAELDSPSAGPDTTGMYILPLKADGKSLDVTDTTLTDADASTDNPAMDTTMVLRTPTHNLYVGYGNLEQDGIPPNGAPYTFGITFPSSPVIGQFHLRNDFLPNVLFRWDGNHWLKFEENVRMNLTHQGTDNTTDRGQYDQSIVYQPGDRIAFGSEQFVCVKTTAAGFDPSHNPTFWRQVQSTMKTSFINNTTTATIGGKVVQERQSLSKALRPQADA